MALVDDVVTAIVNAGPMSPTFRLATLDQGVVKVESPVLKNDLTVQSGWFSRYNIYEDNKRSETVKGGDGLSACLAKKLNM